MATDPRDKLLRDAASFCRATQFLFSILPDHFRAAHLTARARDLARRIDAVVPPQQTEGQ